MGSSTRFYLFNTGRITTFGNGFSCGFQSLSDPDENKMANEFDEALNLWRLFVTSWWLLASVRRMTTWSSSDDRVRRLADAQSQNLYLVRRGDYKISEKL